MGEHHLIGLGQVADHPVEADPGQPVLAFEFLAGFGEQHDVDVGRQHRTGELGVAAFQADVDRVAQVALGELLGSAPVDEHGAAVDRGTDLVVGHRRRHLGLVEQSAVLAVEDRVVDEVAGRGRLPLGDQVHERRLVGCAQRVVGRLLVAHRRPQVGRQVLAARRAGAVRGIDPGRVRQGHQLVVQRVVELVGEFVAGEADRGQQVGSAHVADEQGVAGHHAVGNLVVGVLVDHDAHRLGRVPGGVAELQRHVAQRIPLAVGDTHRLELGLGDRGVDDLRAGGLRQFEVTGQEVGVEVGLDDQFDGQALFLGVGHVLGHVALRVDNDCAAGGFVTDQVRGVGQAVQVVLLEDHRWSSFSWCSGNAILAYTPTGMSSTLGGILFPLDNTGGGMSMHVNQNIPPVVSKA